MIFPKALVALLVGLGLSRAAAAAIFDSPVLHRLYGNWRFVAMIYQGDLIPPRDPRLDLRYELGADGKSRLAWSYDDWKSLCERRGEFSVEGEILVDHVTWINPENRADCGQDPDMQDEITTRSPFHFVGERLGIEIPFGSESILYEWERRP